jgi:CelD/BcsL family acetyltransferase involved in cellulose biosynthesis
VCRIPVRIARFVGSGGDTYPDDLGPLFAAGAEERAGHALARAALAWSDVDLVLCTDIDPITAFPSALACAAAEKGRAFVQDTSERIAFIRLPASYAEFLTGLDSKRRYRLRGMRKKLNESYKSRFFVWSDLGAVDRAVDRLAHLHRRRWEYSGGSESFTSAEYVEFHRRIIKACLQRGWLRLYCLEIEGELAAIYYAYRFRNSVYLMQTGFDPALRKSSPGSVLLGHALEHAIGEGNEVFDFLRGEYHYKNELANGMRETVFAAVYRPTLGALVHRLRRITLPLWKARLLRRPPPKLLP